LSRRITSLGIDITRITVASDSVEEISQILREVLQRKPNFVITVGGLGPTFDDKTLQGIAVALGVELKLEDQAKRMVEDKYKKYVAEGEMETVELTPHRLKMATLPQGAKPLTNPVGTAPGVIIRKDDTTIIALPGVPPEMEAIFDDSVIPILKKAAGNRTFFETSIIVTGVMESVAAPLVEAVMHDNPYVYIKSHPKLKEKSFNLEFHLSTMAEDSKIAKNRVVKALLQLTETIQAKGGKTKPIAQP
jgi:molybdopterin-biosynthesis enzyme MoeA-like protein